MWQFAFCLFACLAAASASACSDLGSGEPSGQEPNEAFVDPAPITKRIALGCQTAIFPAPFIVRWELSVDPGPVALSVPLGAQISGAMVFDVALLGESLGFTPGGYTRMNVREARATVRVRSGATTDSSMETELVPTPIQGTCTYDRKGLAGPRAGPNFPPCSPANDALDGSNSDCTGLGGRPHSDNRCGHFVSLTTLDDCERCAEELGKGAQCSDFGFCILDDLRIPLQQQGSPTYTPVGPNDVLFGWDEADVEHERLYFATEVGPNGLRAWLPGALRIDTLAVECTMVGATSVSAKLDVPAPDSDLISFPIQLPVEGS